MALLELVVNYQDTTAPSNPFANRFHYIASGAIVGNELSDRLQTVFELTVLDAILDVMSAIMTVTTLTSYDLFNPLDFFQTVNGLSGTDVNQAAPRQDVLKFTTPVYIRKRNPGRKAFGRFPHAMIDSVGAIVPAYQATVGNLEAALGATLVFNDADGDTTFTPAILYYPAVIDGETGKKTYPLPATEMQVNAVPATDWSFRWVSGQNTRQR